MSAVGDQPPEEARDDWVELTQVAESADAAAIMDLLRRAKVPARLDTGAADAPSADPLVLGGATTWVVEVPAVELPVAAGVIDHFLGGLRHQPEGDLDEAAILAAMQEPDDPEFAAAVAEDRARRVRADAGLRAGLLLIAAVVFGVVGVVVASRWR